MYSTVLCVLHPLLPAVFSPHFATEGIIPYLVCLCASYPCMYDVFTSARVHVCVFVFVRLCLCLCVCTQVFVCLWVCAHE